MRPMYGIVARDGDRVYIDLRPSEQIYRRQALYLFKPVCQDHTYFLHAIFLLESFYLRG